MNESLLQDMRKPERSLSFGVFAGMSFGKLNQRLKGTSRLGKPAVAAAAAATTSQQQSLVGASSAAADPKSGTKTPTKDTSSGLGPRWPKGMWDNMEGHWRMVMAPPDEPGGFVVTPENYNRHFEQEFRQTRERVSYAEVEANRRRVRKWLADPSANFAL